jgi:peptidoglycan hydrolase CwlO-like protein
VFADVIIIGLLLAILFGPRIKVSTLRRIEGKMATQEERLKAVVAKLGAIQAGIDKLQEQVATLKANNPDLEDELSEIEGTIATMDADVNPPAPEPEPTPEG